MRLWPLWVLMICKAASRRSRGAISADAAHGKIHAHTLVAQRLEGLKRSLGGTFQVIGIGLQRTRQRAVPVAALAFKVRNGMHARWHGLVAPGAAGIDAAKQQPDLREPVNQAVQRDPVQLAGLIGQRHLQLRMGVAGVRVRQQPAEYLTRSMGATQAVSS